MSHHFDTATAREDPRINICDFYLFRGRPGSMVMAMTVNPDAGLSAPDTFREDALYAFRIDLNDDAREEVTFKIRFGAVRDVGGEAHKHVQNFEVRRATGLAALLGVEGEVIAAGRTNETLNTQSGVSVFAGLTPDMFAGDAAALEAFRGALLKEGRFNPKAFQNRQNYFAKRNVTAIVIEFPIGLVGKGRVRAWATVSLVGHAPEVQVSRYGLPLLTHVFLSDQTLREDYNHSTPADDPGRFSRHISQLAEQLTTLAGSAADPSDYARRLAARLCPTTMPYELDTVAAFDFVSLNGRALTDDVMDLILTLATNTALGDGVTPDRTRTRSVFPYFGAPYTSAEQETVVPHGVRAKK